MTALHARFRGSGMAKRITATSTALLVGTMLSGPALAQQVNEPPVNGEIVSFPERDFVELGGFAANQPAVIEVIRNGVVVSASDPDGRTNAQGALEVNHPGGVCWVRRTPDILPGDVIRATVGEAPNQTVDQTTTANVQAGTQEIVGDTVVIRGNAEDITRPGIQPLPIGNIEQRLINPDLNSGTNGRSLRAPGDGSLRYDTTTEDPTDWVATYTEQSTPGDLAADIASGAIEAAESRILWLGQDPLAEKELTIFETPVDGGPQAPCTAPLARTAITSLDREFINIANVGEGMVVSGVAQEEATAVSVSVPGGGEHAGTFTPNPTPDSGQTWTATIPPADLAGLAQGRVVVTATFTGPGTPNNDSLALTKDTEAPTAPTATPGPKRYARAQRVTLEAQGGTTVRFTTNGSDPIQNGREFTTQIVVTSSQTIKAVAIDAADNPSPVKSFRYQIVRKRR